jgi:hypothetical protein
MTHYSDVECSDIEHLPKRKLARTALSSNNRIGPGKTPSTEVGPDKAEEATDSATFLYRNLSATATRKAAHLPSRPRRP